MDEKEILDKIKKLKDAQIILEDIEKEYDDVRMKRDEIRKGLLDRYYPENYTMPLETRLSEDIKELRLELCKLRGE